MQKKKLIPLLILLVFTIVACNLPSGAPTAPPTAEQAPTLLASVPPTVIPATEAPTISETATPEITHILYPAASVPISERVYDVISVDTAPEKRAPYGDSYKINLLERPFEENMTYVADLDLVSFNLNSDTEWYYVSIELVGKNPNNEIGIQYGIEIDNDADGFGDTIIWASPPYTQDWTNDNVQIMQDKTHDTAGLSAVRSDAPLQTDGYETLIFDLNGGLATDPDLAWVRTTFAKEATIQFAFKRSLTDGTFMLGVIADAGLRDVGQLDYIDRFSEADAGSPVKNNAYYPLKSLYLVDNTCREAFGFEATGYEPMLCPHAEVIPTEESGEQPKETTTVECKFPLSHNDSASCQAAGCVWKQTSSSAGEISYCGRP